MPRLQFTKGGSAEKPTQAASTIQAAGDLDKKELRQEVKRWWHAIAEHLDNVVSFFSPLLSFCA
jgi:hypothetical protein